MTRWGGSASRSTYVTGVGGHCSATRVRSTWSGARCPLAESRLASCPAERSTASRRDGVSFGISVPLSNVALQLTSELLMALAAQALLSDSLAAELWR